ncbi:MAG TPA: multicopper oxidase domain-containing protein [Steroidobacteraceae bacterium]|nr:multicopper oxidase domain-containing protein [Steroidobacteraceae bacterium]
MSARTIPVLGFIAASTLAWDLAVASESPPACPRPDAGIEVPQPVDLRSHEGVLALDLTVRNEKLANGRVRYCYLSAEGAQAPTLRVRPGDELVLHLKNALTELDAGSNPRPQTHEHSHAHPPVSASADPCTSGIMSATSANLHFHGMTVPSVCHQDEVLRTSIQPTDPPFEYRFRIPADEPPGLYWYHPHIHGFSSRQVQGGASGALVVEGLERANPDVAGLPERVLVIRDQDLENPDAPPSAAEPATQVLLDRDGDAANTGTGAGKPAKDLTVNFVPVPYPDYPRPTIHLKPGERQLWRVLNASSVTYLDLAVLYQRGAAFRPQWIGVVAVDGVPVNGERKPGHSTQWRNSMVVPPGGRLEFILIGPPDGVPGMLVTRWVNTGEGGENDPNRALVSIVAAADAPEPPLAIAAASAATAAPVPSGDSWLGHTTPVRVRKLYFSEDAVDPAHPNNPQHFYLTVDGQTPAAFNPSQTQPNIIAKQGEVEDWIIENRSTEVHAFHIHQIHFQVVDWLGVAVNEPFLRDTVAIPFYNPAMKSYPSVRLRMDFRDPNSVGTFVYHCHLLDHEDGGMMGLIRVDPAH